ncbi:MAG TPA: TonB-dependent receptor [Edaphobacter sp.]|nr:TonB-dependent receptor [Edaphobacter sp.]
MTFKNIHRQATLRRGTFNLREFAGFLALLTAIVLFATSSANAQLAGKGEIKGVVTDSSGAVIPGAVLTATSTTQGTKVSRTSSSSGDFDITPLNPDVYTLTVTAKGFQTLTQQDVHVNALEVADLKLTMTIGSETQTVNVSAAPPQLETSNATLGATMENDVYSALPVEMGAYGQPDQRRATDFAYLMPGVQSNNTNGNATTNAGIVNGSGSRGAVSAIYIDGIPFIRAGGNGDPRFVWTAISVDAVDQFQVQTNGYSAIYEGQGIQNYNIKQGGNKYHGAVYEFFRNTALDTWGFFGPANLDPVTKKPVKPIEKSNEYGILLSGPVIPFGTWRDKLFFFGNYNGFHYSSQTPTPMTFPTAAEQAGNFNGLQTGGIFDPSTEAACQAFNGSPCRYRYGFTHGATPGSAQVSNCPTTHTCEDVIPSSQFSAVALKLQSFLPSGIGTSATNNYIAPNFTGLTNWSTTDRIDYNITSKDTLSVLAAIGRQASAVPQGQTTAGRNVGPVPYNFGQAFTPKTAVGVIEETHIFSPHIVNQFKYGYARYNGPTLNPNFTPAFAASSFGITGLPDGQAAGGFPSVTFAGTAAPTNWGGEPASVTIAENYTLLDNVQWNVGKHSLTIGGQIAWLLYQVTPNTGGSSFLTMATAVTETAGLQNGTFAATPNTGLSYASFLIGQIDKGSLTQNVVQEYGSRFRAISPYVQDNWKVTEKLTLDLGLRYDFFPSLREAHDNMSFFNPNLPNPVTGVNGALEFTGTGANSCNCRTPVNDYYKNFGPRLGLAYQIDPKTVIRASYGVMYTHGNGVGGGGGTAGLAGNTLGFSASPSFSANAQLLGGLNFGGNNGAFPAYTQGAGRASGPAFGTGFTTTSGFTGTPSTVDYYDPYLGGRAPQYINWSFGFQHQWTDAFTTSMSYVGSQGHFLIADSSNARGFFANQLDPKYLALNPDISHNNLALSGAALQTFCAANTTVCPPTFKNFTSGQNLGTLLKPFPFNGTADFFANTSNSNYNALQVTANMRASHGLTIMANYTWSRTIDDGGTFRSGYDIPAAFSGNGKAWKQDAIERSVSTSNQPQHAVITGVWDLPIGRSILAGNAIERAVFGGFKFSEIFQAYSGSPLPITGNSCGTNPAQATCMPTYNPSFSGPARIHGKWGQGVTAASATIANTATPSTQSAANQFIDVSAFTTTAFNMFGNTSRTAPYNIYGPGNYQLDIALARAIPLHLGESSRLNLRAEMYNVTNHTLFGVASTAWGATNFGEVTNNPSYNRRSAQLSARIQF